VKVNIDMATYPGQQPVLQFPSDPMLNQEFVGDNGATYVWAGDRWSSALAIAQNKAKYIIDGQYAESTMNIILDGNGA
jgi:hypothetical protein